MNTLRTHVARIRLEAVAMVLSACVAVDAVIVDAAERAYVSGGADVQSGSEGSAGTPGAPYPNMPAIAPIGVRTGKYLDIPDAAKGPTFRDPDGNGWLLQEIRARLPGRGESNMDVTTLRELLREAETRHAEYERTAPKHHWSDWYAAYIVARGEGRTPDEAAKQAPLHLEARR
jgi:hypothetical protein